MNIRVISTIIFAFYTINHSYSQIYSDQGLKRSSLLKVEKINWDRLTFAAGGLSINNSSNAIYGMLGTLRKFGPFISIKTNLNFNNSYDLGGSRWNEDQFYKDQVHINRLAVAGGLMWRTYKPIIVYGGIGYGKKNVTWETISGKRYRVYDYSSIGFELESGIIYELNKVLINCGVSIGGGGAEFNFGMGIPLKNINL
jgi:opacity protein-like surface antigen